ncbi:MAG: hypothetical protein N3F04_01165 [Candidatus Nezhaarchaeota archaeon]|nr:hypothetical protein [Candidatus Nezhaarchaeota archaeon]MCX8141387.1 hypothetical protein [Candidatus Nezhaarchaeota archaeon]MDW8049653.1 hypothetical protein [Nitrososphaerota archaeon]
MSVEDLPRLLHLRLDRRFLIGNIGLSYEEEIKEKGVKDYDKVLLKIEKLDSSKALEIPAYFHWIYTMAGKKPQFIVMAEGHDILLREGFRDMEPIKLTIIKVLK